MHLLLIRRHTLSLQAGLFICPASVTVASLYLLFTLSFCCHGCLVRLLLCASSELQCDLYVDSQPPVHKERTRLYIGLAIAKTYRPIIDKRNLHHGLEDTILDFVCCVALLHLVKEALVEPLCLIAPQRPVEIRLISLLGGGQQGELRDAENLPVDVLDVLLPLMPRRGVSASAVRRWGCG